MELLPLLWFKLGLGDIMVLLERKRVKARKIHHCDMCGKVIEVGEEYEAQHIIGDDGPYTFHQCYRCKPYVDELWSIGFDGYYSDGLDPDTFDTFMWEEHRDVFYEWQGWDPEDE